MIKAWAVTDSSGMLAWFHSEALAKAWLAAGSLPAFLFNVVEREVNPRIFATTDERGGYLFPFYTSFWSA